MFEDLKFKAWRAVFAKTVTTPVYLGLLSGITVAIVSWGMDLPFIFSFIGVILTLTSIGAGTTNLLTIDWQKLVVELLETKKKSLEVNASKEIKPYNKNNAILCTPQTPDTPVSNRLKQIENLSYHFGSDVEDLKSLYTMFIQDCKQDKFVSLVEGEIRIRFEDMIDDCIFNLQKVCDLDKSIKRIRKKNSVSKQNLKDMKDRYHDKYQNLIRRISIVSGIISELYLTESQEKSVELYRRLQESLNQSEPVVSKESE